MIFLLLSDFQVTSRSGTGEATRINLYYIRFQVLLYFITEGMQGCLI